MIDQLDALARAPSNDATMQARRRWAPLLVTAAVVLLLVALAAAAWQRERTPGSAWATRWSNARIERVTDFPGSEVDATISPDGRSVAFLADRDGIFDAFVTAVGSERFVNLTGGRLPELLNEDVRNVGFTADGANVWLRVAGITNTASISLVPASGGTPRPFLATAATVAWSPDGSRIVYHQASPGDSMFVADASGAHARLVTAAPPGVHGHHPTWSPDGRFIYFARGIPPDEMDIWRVAADGHTAPERITRQSARIAYPVLLDDRTLLYTATADDGTGPWLYMMDVEDRVAHRLSTTVEHYISIAASADVRGKPRRLVATVSNPSVHLWSVPLSAGIAAERDAREIVLPTARSAAPRFSPDSSMLYLASRGGADGLWRLPGAQAVELWKGEAGAVVGAAAVAPDGRTICFPVRRDTRSTLYCTRSDGTGAHAIAPSLDVRGAASWSPDGKWLAVAGSDGAGVRVFKIALGGGAPVRLVDSVSSNPVWSPDGRFILYSGTPRGRNVPVHAVTPDGRPWPLPALSVDRVGDSYRFAPGGRQVVVKLGGFRRQDFWLLDLATGTRRPLTSLRHGESINRFDVSADGRRIVFERMEENSDVVLIELAPR